MNFSVAAGGEISLADIKKDCQNNTDITYYLANDNKQSNIEKLQQEIEKLGRSFYLQKSKYALEEDSFIYSVHIV